MSAIPDPLIPCGRLGYMISGSPPERVTAIADALEAKLVVAGWQQLASGSQFVRGKWRVDFRARLAAVAARTVSAEQWQEGCRLAGIGTLQIALPPLIPPASSAYAPPLTFSSPVPSSDPPSTGLQRKVPLWLVFAIVALLLGGLGWLLLSQRSPIRPPSGGDVGKGTYITADGRSSLPGGFASAKYEVSGHDWETVYQPNNVNGIGDGSAWYAAQILPSTKLHMGIGMRLLRPAIETPAIEKKWLGFQQGEITSRAGKSVQPTSVKIDGRPAHAWEFVDREGEWSREIWLVQSIHSFRFNCTAKNPSAADLAIVKERCNDFLATVKVRKKD